MPSKFLIVIAGPTAVGKTELCIKIAKFYKAEVVSADSRQFYKEMEIGTAKPTVEEMSGVTHHFINNISIHDDYDVGQYEKEALNCIANIHQHSDIAILTGGSGLFIKAVCEGFDTLPKVSEEVRTNLIHSFKKKGIEALQEALKEKDLEYYNSVDLNNPQRLMRALEVIEFTGKPFSSFRKGEKKLRPFIAVKIMLNRDREELYDRINKRMDWMLAQGLLEEATHLYPLKHLNALQTVGYQEVFNFLEGVCDWDETIRFLKQNSRRYAKRQLTWFRKDKEFTWFHPDELDKIIEFIGKRVKTNIS